VRAFFFIKFIPIERLIVMHKITAYITASTTYEVFSDIFSIKETLLDSTRTTDFVKINASVDRSTVNNVDLTGNFNLDVFMYGERSCIACIVCGIIFSLSELNISIFSNPLLFLSWIFLRLGALFG
jgi:hypothetical protein